MRDKYTNNGFEILKKIAPQYASEELNNLVDYIQEQYNNFNKGLSKYTENYYSTVINCFNSFDVENCIYSTYGGKKRSIVGAIDDNLQFDGIKQSCERYITKLETLKYLDFLKEEKRNVVMVGPNGCGKTTLLRHLIEGTGKEKIGYYQADRLLVVNSNYNPKRDFKSFSNELNYNTYHANDVNEADQGYYIGQQFDQVISLFEKTRSQELEMLVEKKITENELLTKYIIDSWNYLVKDRKLTIKDGLKAIIPGEEPYEIKYLSSGEKSIFYFLTSILLNDEKKYYFIDEPENNLNSSVVNGLWDMIERKRPNSIFVYLTHNSEFVSSRVNSKVFWIKKYDGKSWETALLKENDNLPQELMISLVGNRQNVLFCESENETKYDTLIFKILFPTLKVVSAGGCDKVQAKVKAFKELGLPEKAFGIIDCDYKRDDYLFGLEKNGVYHMPFFEIENFLVSSKILFPYLKENLHENSDACIADIKKEVAKLFAKNKDIFVIRNVAFRLHEKTYQDRIKSLKTIEELKNSFADYYNKINIDEMINEFETKANEIIKEDNYDTYLRYLDSHGIIKLLKPFMKLGSSMDYGTDVLSYLKNNDELISEIIKEYLPMIES